MIIEMLGISGVGKTTVTKALFAQFKEKGQTVVWPRYRLYVERGWLRRNLVKGASVIMEAIQEPSWVKAASAILKTLSITKKDQVILLFNYLSCKSLLNQSKKRYWKYLYDEGVFQLIWATYLRTEVPPSRDVVLKLLSLFPLPEKLMIVEADTALIAQRLRNRGSHTKILESSELEAKIESMKKRLEKIVDIAISSNRIPADSVVRIQNGEADDVDQQLRKCLW